MTNPLPSRIDRETLDRIIQRAAELQTSERDIGEGLTPEEVLALGKEVGIPANYLQQAMLEQQGSLAARVERGFLGRTLGPGEVSVQRVVLGDSEDAARALLGWMDKNELLVIQRQQTGRVSWEPMRGMQAAIRRGTAALDTSKPRFMLSRAELVAATLTPIESGYTHVSLSATLRQTRGHYVGGAVVVGSVGVAAVATFSVLNAVWFITAAPLLPAFLVGYSLLRQYPPVVQRVRLGLERALDFLERGGIKPAHEMPPRSPGLLEVLAGEVRKAIAASSEKPRKR